MKWLYCTLITFIIGSIGNGQEDFNLAQAIEYALQSQNSIQLANLEIEEAEADILEIRSIGMPKVSGSIDYQYYIAIPASPVEDFISPSIYGILSSENLVTSVPTGPFDPFEFSVFSKNNINARIDASWLIFDGSYLVGLKAAKLYKELTRKKKDITIEEIKSSVTKAYMNIVIAQENKKTLQKNLDNIKISKREAQAYYETGFIEQLEVSRLELSLETIKTELDKIDQLIEISYDLLKFQIAYPLSKEIRLTDDLDKLVTLLGVATTDLNTEVDMNDKPIYVQLELNKELSELNVKRLKKGYYPNLVARAGVSEVLQRNSLFDSNEVGWIPTVSAGLGVNIPIYDGALKKGQIQKAKIETNQIDIQKSEYKRSLELQIKNEKAKYINAKKTLDSRRKLLDITEDIYNKTNIKFREGVGSSIEVTQAEDSLYTAQGNYINAIYELLITKTDLDITLGKI